MKRGMTFLLVWFGVALPVRADDFGKLVQGIEARYGVRPMAPRLIGVALFLGKPAMWGSGLGGLKVAVFGYGNGSLTPPVQDVDDIVVASLNPEWRSFARVDSRKQGETVIIYRDLSRDHMRIVIASIEHDGLTVVHMKMNAKSIRRWVADPAKEARRAHHH